MSPWRWAVVAVLGLLIAPPLIGPFIEVVTHWPGLGPWTEAERLLSLALNTLLLVAGTLTVALPVGVILAVLLYRTDLPLRRWFQFLTVVFLFVPLPLLASAWQAALGTGGWLPVVLWQNQPGQPWTHGLGPAIWLHSLAAIPWVVLLVGQGLCWVEGELEEEALLLVHPLKVLWFVTLPRCRATIIAAGVWVALQAASEITVVYMMQVPTFAEQVHTQFTQGTNPLAEALLLTVPGVVLAWLAVALIVPRFEKQLPPLSTMLTPPGLFTLGSARWPSGVAVILLIAFVCVIPLCSLIWKTGLHGAPREWSAMFAWDKFQTTFLMHGSQVGGSLLWAAVAGTTTAVLAILCSWVARESHHLRIGLMALAVLAAVLPGPVIGLGLKGVVDAIVTVFPNSFVEQALYIGPSHLPGMWVQVVRFFPYALLLIWPVVRLIPREYFDLVRVEGGRPIQEFTHVVWPLAGRAALWTAVLTTALSLSEVAASVRVETPGTESFTKLIFDRMHYGVDNDVAALALVLLAWLVLATPVIAAAYWLNRRAATSPMATPPPPAAPR